MNCRRCNEKLMRGWNYCPKCGERVVIGIGINSLLQKFMGMRPGAKMKVKVVRRPIRKKGITMQKLVNPNVKVIEPESEIFQEDSGVKLKIKLPGVKTAKDIHLKRMGDSLELNAFTKTKRYFKILNLEKLKIIKKIFSKEILTLSLE